MPTVESRLARVNTAPIKPYKWAFPTQATRPMRPRCAGCDAPHGKLVWRLKARPLMWWPGPEQPPSEHEYHATPQKVDLMVGDYCSFCVKQSADRRSA